MPILPSKVAFFCNVLYQWQVSFQLLDLYCQVFSYKLNYLSIWHKKLFLFWKVIENNKCYMKHVICIAFTYVLICCCKDQRVRNFIRRFVLNKQDHIFINYNSFFIYAKQKLLKAIYFKNFNHYSWTKYFAMKESW